MFTGEELAGLIAIVLGLLGVGAAVTVALVVYRLGKVTLGEIEGRGGVYYVDEHGNVDNLPF